MTMRNTPDLNADSELDIVTGGKLASDLIPLSPTDVVKDRLRRRLLHRVAVTAQDHAIMRTVRAEDGLWRRIAPGAEMKALYQDGRSHAFLIRLEPGATLPAHPHAADEECLVLEGEMHLGDLKFRAGDFHVARAGSAHGTVFSPSGGLVYVRSAGAAGYP